MLIPLCGISQSDTSHLYIDYVELNFADTSEKLISLTLQNKSNSLVFKDVSELSMIGIDRAKICDLKVHTNRSIFVLQNINESINFIGTKYRISIFVPANHKTCVYTTYVQPDGMELLHSQSTKQIDIHDNFDNCIVVNSGPTGYTRFEEFEINFTLY
jgi:hypothetical protein